VLVLLPASERKASVIRGEPVDLGSLSFPSLTPTRTAVLDALTQVSARPDATKRLGVPASLSDTVHRNVTLRDAPAAPAGNVYAGPLHEGLGANLLDAASRRRARNWVVVISALWGAVRLSDRIPPYRLNMCGRLPGLPHLTDVWREPLGGVLPDAARRGIVVDCRSAEFATAWRPSGELAERTVVVKLRAASHDAKHVRGLLARRIVTDAIDPTEPPELAGALSEHFKLELVPPDRPGRSWSLRIIEALA
jgi:cytoplasmic iron level regulating protein YaaA (DUF328/UPF0246 family)